MYCLFYYEIYRFFRDDAQQEPAVPVAVPSIDEFPTLGERSSTPQNFSQQRGAWGTESSRQVNSLHEFPALPSAANNGSNTNVNQARGIWREQQVTPSSSSTSTNVTAKKAAQPTKTSNNETASINTVEDFPALQGASNTRIRAPASMFSAWSTAKKAAKHVSGNCNNIVTTLLYIFVILSHCYFSKYKS